MASADTVAGDGRVAALDGLRALAVALVLAYHGGVPGLQVGGFYGVDVFFVLSGFLITRLLLRDQAAHGRVGFAQFWGRRARRLLPAFVVMLVAVDLYVAYLAPAGRYPGFRGDALSTLTYWSNWHFIAGLSNYFNATGFPSLLTHTWSLALEEQFYVVWPVVVWGAVWVARRSRIRPASFVLAVSALGALASAGWMAVLYRRGADPSRLYYGTDTHALSILVGCALGAVTCLVTIRIGARLATAAAALAAAGLGWAACSLGSSNPLAYEGGFLAVSLLAAVLVVSAIAAPAGLPAKALSFSPLAYLGRISYGMYLWYFPLFAVIDRSSTGLGGAPLFVARLAADIAAAALSFHLIEQPIRAWRPAFRLQVPSGLGTLAVAGAAVVVAGAVVVIDSPATSAPVAGPVAITAQATSMTSSGLRILVFGDSTAATLGDALALSSDAQQHRIQVDVSAVFGCGLAMSAAVDLHGQPTTPPVPCRAGTAAPDAWPALLAAAIAKDHPAVVLIASGRWEVESRRATPGGPWVDITEPQDAAYVESQIETASSIVLASGAHLALATAPCFSSGEQPNGDPWPEDSAKRLGVYNSLIRDVAARDTAGVVDLDSLVCPGGKYRTTIDGVTVRAPDGIHYPYWTINNPKAAAPDTLAEVEKFGAWIEPKVLQELTGRPH